MMSIWYKAKEKSMYTHFLLHTEHLWVVIQSGTLFTQKESSVYKRDLIHFKLNLSFVTCIFLFQIINKHKK